MKVIALTAGDPNSIAPLISLKAWQRLKDRDICFVLISNEEFMKEIIKFFNFDIKTKIIEDIREAPNYFKDYLPIFNIKEKPLWNLGKRDKLNSQFILASLDKAIDLALKQEISAITTNPLDKDIINQHLPEEFLGHTDYLASKTSSLIPVMMMATSYSSLRVIPLTTHISLKEAISVLNIDYIYERIKIVNIFLKDHLKIEMPKIGVLGLNPHAGEQGLMGKEEIDIIIPVIRKLREEGILCEGAIAADSAFTSFNINKYDVFIGMYHDQVLAPFKTLYFAEGVNTTLGLNIIRTSPNHGTAFDIANKGIASEKSLVSAIEYAYNLAR